MDVYYKFGEFLKFLIILLFIPMCVSAEIFKCIDKGAPVFSDTPCGKDAAVIHIDPQVSNGYQFSNEKLGKLADDMHSDRMKKELELQIERQLIKIEKIDTAYLENIDTLESELRELKAARNDYKWNGNESKRRNYYKKKNEITDNIAATKRKYKSDRRLAYIDLAQLKEKLRNQ